MGRETASTHPIRLDDGKGPGTGAHLYGIEEQNVVGSEATDGCRQGLRDGPSEEHADAFEPQSLHLSRGEHPEAVRGLHLVPDADDCDPARGPEAARQASLKVLLPHAAIPIGSSVGYPYVPSARFLGRPPVRAYVLVKVTTGRERAVFDKLNEIAGLEEIHYLFGDWDYILSIRTTDTISLSRLITERIRRTPGIAQTHTLIEAPTR